MKKQKLEAGLYVYGDYRIQKEYMGETVGMKAVRRWNVLQLGYGGWTVLEDSPSLKAAKWWIDKGADETCCSYKYNR